MLEVLTVLISVFTTLFIFMLGAAVGSFLNVVIYRVPEGLSVLWPPSRCPKCLNQLGKAENVPILGWLWLKGRCKNCRTPIAARYPMIELLTALMFVGLYFTFGVSIQAVGLAVFFCWLLALSMIDLDTMLLPNPLTQSGLLLGIAFQVVIGLSNGLNWDAIASQLMFGIIGAVVGVWLFDSITILGSVMLGQPAMGGGDAKLAAMIGAWLGWQQVLLSSFIACAIGAFIGGGAIALGLMSRRQPMPFGPYLALGGMIAAMWGSQLINGYLQFFFPTL